MVYGRKSWLSRGNTCCQEGTLVVRKKYWLAGGNNGVTEETLDDRKKRWLSGGNINWQEEKLAVWRKYYMSGGKTICLEEIVGLNCQEGNKAFKWKPLLLRVNTDCNNNRKKKIGHGEIMDFRRRIFMLGKTLVDKK